MKIKTIKEKGKLDLNIYSDLTKEEKEVKEFDWINEANSPQDKEFLFVTVESWNNKLSARCYEGEKVRNFDLRSIKKSSKVIEKERKVKKAFEKHAKKEVKNSRKKPKQGKS